MWSTWRKRVGVWTSRMAVAVALSWTAPVTAGEVAVAVASNFTAPMQQIAQAFEQQTGHRVKLSSGGTGALYAQIRHGAPFDLLLAADTKIPAKLAQQGYADERTQFTYGTGQLVLWSANPTLIDGLNDSDGDILREGKFRKFAIADPMLAPYGAAAQQVLQALGLWQAIKPKIVQGKNIGQAFQFVSSGNAELGLVALAQVYADGKIESGSGWIVPHELYSPIRQDAILLKPGQANPVAHELVTYLKGEQVQQIIESYGYQR
ncbi:MAG TPA: molybdate ABC transporter substrate-binding protein [Orrella sp.]